MELRKQGASKEREKERENYNEDVRTLLFDFCGVKTPVRAGCLTSCT